MKMFPAMALAAVTLFSSAAFAKHTISDAQVRAALNESPAFVGAIAEIRKMVTSDQCRKVEIQIQQVGEGMATIKATGVCFSKTTGEYPDEEESAASVTVEGTMFGPKSLMIEKIEFFVAG